MRCPGGKVWQGHGGPRQRVEMPWGEGCSGEEVSDQREGGGDAHPTEHRSTGKGPKNTGRGGITGGRDNGGRSGIIPPPGGRGRWQAG